MSQISLDQSDFDREHYLKESTSFQHLYPFDVANAIRDACVIPRMNVGCNYKFLMQRQMSRSSWVKFPVQEGNGMVRIIDSPLESLTFIRPLDLVCSRCNNNCRLWIYQIGGWLRVLRVSTEMQYWIVSSISFFPMRMSRDKQLCMNEVNLFIVFKSSFGDWRRGISLINLYMRNAFKKEVSGWVWVQ